MKESVSRVSEPSMQILRFILVFNVVSRCSLATDKVPPQSATTMDDSAADSAAAPVDVTDAVMSYGDVQSQWQDMSHGNASRLHPYIHAVNAASAFRMITAAVAAMS